MSSKKKQISLTYMLLESIAYAIDNNNSESSWYLDVENEETIILSDYSDIDEDLFDLIENDDGERFISIPSRPSYEGWNQMERFIISLDDQEEKIQNMLLTSIHGKGAFSRFKDTIYNLDLEDRWFEFKSREDTKEALEWLHSVDLINEDDLEKGMQIFEQRQAAIKQRETDIEMMTAGTTVKCASNEGHAGKITPGKSYKVLDERKQQLLIRINDDRGKEVWIPKSHFELVHLRKA